MTRITNSEQIMLLLKAQLERAERVRDPKQTRKAAKPGPVEKGPLDRLPGIVSSTELPERSKHRALIGAILGDAFGPSLINDPGMQTVIDQVVDQMRTDDDLRRTLDQALDELVRDANP